MRTLDIVKERNCSIDWVPHEEKQSTIHITGLDLQNTWMIHCGGLGITLVGRNDAKEHTSTVSINFQATNQTPTAIPRSKWTVPNGRQLLLPMTMIWNFIYLQWTCFKSRVQLFSLLESKGEISR